MMEFTGKIVGFTQDVINGTCSITFTVNERREVLRGLPSIKDLDKLKITAVKYRKKRSLDANAYYWVILTKLAEKLQTSKDELHNIMLGRYGQVDKDDEGNSTIFSLRSDIDISKRYDLHAKPIGVGYVSEKEFTHYVMLKGSHLYDSKEMSILINGLVDEAKEQGIETLTPEELERMVNAWRPKS
jgi:hypothetical protein